MLSTVQHQYCSTSGELELISVSKSTMITIITLIVLVSVGIVTVDGECQPNGRYVESCCCLGYNNNYNAKNSGVYIIPNFCGVKYSDGSVYCDTKSGGGGWTVIQRRYNGGVNFTDRDWVEYEDGFGSLYGEFWIGLRSMHCLTSQGNWELRIDFELDDRDGTKSYLHYNKFAVGPASDQYRLSISGFDTIGLNDVFGGHSQNGLRFTSRDRDNDLRSDSNCAYYGGWWHNNCGHIALNNVYIHSQLYLNGNWYSVSSVEMKIRIKDCKTN